MGIVVFLLNQAPAALLCKRDWAKNKQSNFEREQILVVMQIVFGQRENGVYGSGTSETSFNISY